MKDTTVGNVRWKVALWISWMIVVAVFAFGAAVEVDFVDPSVPLSQAWASASLAHMAGSFQHREYMDILITSVVCVILQTFHPSWKLRLGAMAVGAVVPVIAIGPVVIAGMVFAPWMILNALAGMVDGEFYEEGMLMFAACGLWMLVCLVFSAREACRAWCARKPALMENA